MAFAVSRRRVFLLLVSSGLASDPLAVGDARRAPLRDALQPLGCGAARLEWVLNTPRHHRVHHACNEACLDTNYGSTLIVFDRLFGTFAEAPQDETMRFGLK